MISIKSSRRKISSSISKVNSKPSRRKKNPSKRSEKPRKKHSRIMRIGKLPTKLAEWKSNWSNSARKPKNKLSQSTTKKNRSENCTNSTLSRKKKSGKFKINWKRKNPTMKKSASKPSHSLRMKLNSWKTREPKSRSKATRRSEDLKGKEKSWRTNLRGRNLSSRKRKKSWGWTNLNTKKSSDLSILMTNPRKDKTKKKEEWSTNEEDKPPKWKEVTMTTLLKKTPIPKAQPNPKKTKDNMVIQPNMKMIDFYILILILLTNIYQSLKVSIITYNFLSLSQLSTYFYYDMSSYKAGTLNAIVT